MTVETCKAAKTSDYELFLCRGHKWGCERTVHPICTYNLEQSNQWSESCQAWCLPCHPNNPDNLTGQSNPTSTSARDEAAAALTLLGERRGGANTNSNGEEDETEEEYLKRKEVEMINNLCSVFTSQKLGINAQAKRAKVKLLFNHPIEELLGPEQLDQGKADYARLKHMTSLNGWKTKPIKDIAQPVMRLSMMLHKEACQGGDCDHCGDMVDFIGSSIEQEHEAARVFRELYEECNTILKHGEADEHDRQSRMKKNTTKTTFKKLFGASNIPNEMRYNPGMVSYNFACAISL